MASLPTMPVSSIPARKSRLRGREAGRQSLDQLPGGASSSGLPEQRAQPAASEVNRRSICEGLLGDGFVQSFVDFFYLTHRPEPNQKEAEGNAAPAREIKVPPKEMVLVRDNLVQAESARRQGDTGTVYGAYSALAQHYHAIKDPRTGVYFFEKCLEISRLTNDHRGEMASNHDLGLIYQTMGEPATAARYHERHLALATKEGADSEERTAAGELVKVYRTIAESHEAAKRYDAAVQYYTKGLESATVAKDRRSEGLANYRLGRAFVLLDECHRAIAFLEDYEAVCKEIGDREGEGMACAALASAYQSLLNDDKALAYLKTCLDIASATQNLSAQGEACCALGVIYNKRLDFEKAVEYFERNFEIARATTHAGVASSTSIVDIARVYLGMSRGNQMLRRYVYVVNHDPKALLVWKTKHLLPGGL